jgi:hypothetical protein
MVIFLGSLSKSTVETWLHVSEILLLISGAVLFVGIWGEYRKGEKWKKHLALFEAMVLVGVGLELISDGGVFLFSESLQKLEGADIQALDTKSREAADKANDALQKSVAAANASQKANDASNGAIDKSRKAERSANAARKEADSFEKDIVSAKKAVRRSGIPFSRGIERSR